MLSRETGISLTVNGDFSARVLLIHKGALIKALASSGISA